MEQPKLPNAEELKRAESYSAGSAALIVASYLAALNQFLKLQRDEHNQAMMAARHVRLYRYVAVIAGVTLAMSSLALCVYAISAKADIRQIAYVLTPVAGLAGVFLWNTRLAAPGTAKLPLRPLSRTSSTSFPSVDGP